MHYPFAKYSEEPLVTYPLTKDELWILGKFWAETSLDASVFCRLLGQVGSTDLRLWDYVKDRLARIAEILGKKEVETIQLQIEQTMRQRIGEENWRAFVEGRSIICEGVEEDGCR